MNKTELFLKYYAELKEKACSVQPALIVGLIGTVLTSGYLINNWFSTHVGIDSEGSDCKAEYWVSEDELLKTLNRYDVFDNFNLIIGNDCLSYSPSERARDGRANSVETMVESVKQIKMLELLQSSYLDTILPSRIDHLNGLNQIDREKMIESIGGNENIDNGKIVLGIFGKDTDGDRNGVDINGDPLGRNDISIVVVVDIKDKNKVTIASIPRTIALPYHMYGPSTPNIINGLTWIDQANPTKDGGYVPLDRSIAQRLLTDASGYYVDGVVELDFTSATQIVDAIFPNGVSVQMSDTFRPENNILGKINGIKGGDYAPLIVCETYNLTGEQIVALIRARETRKGGTYQRESDASRIIVNILKQMMSQYKDVNDIGDVVSRISEGADLVNVVGELETSRNIRGYFWGKDIPPSELLYSILRAIDPEDVWKAAGSYNEYGEEMFPDFDYFSPQSTVMVAAPHRNNQVFFKSGIDINDAAGHQRNPLLFWSDMRIMMSDHVDGELQIETGSESTTVISSNVCPD